MRRSGVQILLSAPFNNLNLYIMISDKLLPKIIYSPNIDKKHEDIMLEGLYVQARSKKRLKKIEPFSYSIVDDKKNFIAGINGFIIYGALYIDLLWVHDKARGLGYGTLLITKAEKLAKHNSCNFLYLSTMDFEAKSFYQKLRFEIEYVRNGYDNNSVMYYLIKK